MNLINENHENFQKCALIHQNKQVSYINLLENISNVLEKFDENDIKQGDVVLILLPKSVDLIILILSCFSAKVCPLIISDMKSIDLKQLNPKYIFIKKEKYYENNILSNTNIIHLFNTISFYKNEMYDKNNLCIEEDTRLLVTSSGSTGLKKIIKLHENGILENIKGNIKSIGIKPKDITALILPVFYSYGLISQLLSHIYIGATIILVDELFYPLYQTHIINKYKVNSIFTTPIILRKCVSKLNVSTNYKMDSLRYITIGGALAEATLIENARKIFKCDIIKTYGLAEAGPRVSTNIIKKEEKNPNLKSVGFPIDKLKIEIDTEGNQLLGFTNKKAGRIILKSNSISNGYIGEDSKNIIPKQKLITKDIGYLGDKGELYIIGRIDQNIKTKERLVWFNEIAESLYEVNGIIKLKITALNDEIVIKYTPFIFEDNLDDLLFNKLLNCYKLDEYVVKIIKDRNLNITK